MAFDGDRKVIISDSQAIAAKSAAHAFAHKLRLFATIDFFDEGELNIWQIKNKSSVLYVEN